MRIIQALALLLLSLPAFAASITLPAPGQLVIVNLRAGETVTVSIPKAVGCIDLGVYEKSGSVATAGIDLVGGGYKRGGVVRLTHLYGTMKTATITARVATGDFHVTYKVMNQATCLKMARSQAKA